MYLTPSVTNKNNGNGLYFEGQVFKKGKWPFQVTQAFNNVVRSQSESLKNLLEGHDLFFRIEAKTIKNSKYAYQYKGQTVYNLAVSRLKENSKLDRILDFLHIKPRYELTYEYNSPYDLAKCLNEGHLSSLLNKFINKK